MPKIGRPRQQITVILIVIYVKLIFNSNTCPEAYIYVNPGQLDTGQLDTGHLDTGHLDTGQLDTHESGKVGQLDTAI